MTNAIAHTTKILIDNLKLNSEELNKLIDRAKNGMLNSKEQKDIDNTFLNIKNISSTLAYNFNILFPEGDVNGISNGTVS